MRGSDRQDSALFQLAGLVPAILLVTILFLGAFVFAVLQSLGYAPQYGITSFPTFDYYHALFDGSSFWKSLRLTFYYALVPTFIGAVISLCLALFLARKFKGKAIALFLYRIPMVVPYLVGVSLVILLFANGGLFARVLFALDLIASPSDFTRLIQTESGVGIMLVYLWKQVPFMTLILYSNLLVLGRQDEESARLLGATPAQIFYHITFPKMIPSLVTATLIVFAFNFGSFEVPFILGAGFPNTLPVEAWRLFDSPDYTNRPQAMAIVTLISLLSAGCLFLSFYLYRWFELFRGRG